MFETRLHDCAMDARFETDLCVIGTGPAGAAIALELANSAVRVLLIESGAGDGTPVVNSPLDDIESTGVPRVMDQAKLRSRNLGGTSAIWTGRCVAFEEIDFRERPWVPHSGWPVDREHVRPFLDRAGKMMRLGPNRYDESLWPLLSAPKPTPELDADQVVSSFWQYSLDPTDIGRFMHFGDDLAALNADNVRLLSGATVTHLNTADDGSKMTGIEVADRTGRRFTVTAKAFVLAAGGIENARLMLASRRTNPAGVGNANDQVGRFLMDHPRCTIGDFDPRDAEAVLGRFGIYQLSGANGSHPYSHGLALSPKLQEQEGLLHCAAWLTEHRAEDDPWDAIKRLKSGREGRRARDIAAVIRHPRLLARGLRRRLTQGRGVLHKLERLMVDCIVEQRPDAESRLTLSDKLDPLGVPLPRIHWLISDQEKQSVSRLGRVIAEQLAKAGLPKLTLVDWVANGRLEDAKFRDVAHPTGTTKMSATAATGVVDTDCRVHGVKGLYVAGSSVFPTAGHGNPTLMLVALAIRLADHLAVTLKSRDAITA